jgi:hypothetical protein
MEEYLDSRGGRGAKIKPPISGNTLPFKGETLERLLDPR